MSTASEFPFPTTLGEQSDGDEDLIGQGEGGDEGDPGALSPEDRIAEMERRLEQQSETFEQRLAERDRMFQNTLTSVMSGGKAAAQEEGDDLNLDDLPDPVENYQEFRSKLKERIQSHTKNVVSRATDTAQTQNQQQQAFNDVWSRFRTEYPDLAKRNTLLRAAAEQEVLELQGRGADPASAIQTDSEGFIKRVADRMNQELGIDNSASGGKPSPGRTKGTSGGSRAAGKGGGGAKQPASFIDQLKKQQVESGLI